MTNNAKGQQRKITLKLGLQSTEAYYLAFVFFLFVFIRSSVQLKIYAANIEASNVFFFLSVMENYS